jgi:hypothetical protein
MSSRPQYMMAPPMHPHLSTTPPPHDKVEAWMAQSQAQTQVQAVSPSSSSSSAPSLVVGSSGVIGGEDNVRNSVVSVGSKKSDGKEGGVDGIK